MSVTSAIISTMEKLGHPSEHILAVLKAIDAEQDKAEHARKLNAERQARFRSKNNVIPAESNVTGSSLLPPPTPPTNNSSPQPSLRSGSFSARELECEFEEQFWPAWPSRTNKDAARRAYPKARRFVELDQLLAAVEHYRTHKPEDREWMHAATFLNGKRWKDEYQPKPRARASPKRGGGWAEIEDETGASNGPTSDTIRDITPGARNADGSHDPTDLFEPSGGVSRGAKILDFSTVGADARGQGTAYGAAWSTAG